MGCQRFRAWGVFIVKLCYQHASGHCPLLSVVLVDGGEGRIGAGIGGPPHPRAYPHRRAIRWCGGRGRGAGSNYRLAFLVAAGIVSLGVVAALYFFRQAKDFDT